MDFTRDRAWFGSWVLILGLAWAGCEATQGEPGDDDDVVGDDDDTIAGDDDDDAQPDDDDTSGIAGDDDSQADDDDEAAEDPFADAVVSFTPGDYAGFGESLYPDIVLGPPEGGGAGGGSTDVLSLGDGGEIVLEFIDIVAVDGPGADLLVFENPFTGWYETGHVAVSEDGATWFEFPCDPLDDANFYPGCSGVEPVLTSTANGIDATDPALAGGDAYDLADVGLATARYVRVRDSGANVYTGTSGGYDLDAIAVVNGT
jgi:hypothetical protein